MKHEARTMRRGIVWLGVFCLVVSGYMIYAPVAQAVSWIPIVTCGGTGQIPCTPCDIFASLKRVIDLVLYGITGPIAAFMVVYAGGMMLLGGGKPALYGKGKEILTNTLIGVAIILLSWVVTNFLIKSLMTGNQGDSWFEFSCPVGLSTIKPIETAIPTGGVVPPLPAATLLTPEYIGVAAIGYGDGGLVLSCAYIAKEKCPVEPECKKLAPLLSAYPENAKILGAIMLNESSCLIKPKPSGKGAYGLMQMKPETANANRNGCGVTETITAAWLTSEQNKEKMVCIANNYVNAIKRGACGNNPLNIAAGYNGGADGPKGACAPSRDCAKIPSCTGSGMMRRWECPWDNADHTVPNTGYKETPRYAARVAVCVK